MCNGGNIELLGFTDEEVKDLPGSLAYSVIGAGCGNFPDNFCTLCPF